MDTRNSHGLEQFCAPLQERAGLHILDLSGANQQTVSFVTNLGHQLYSDDMLVVLDRIFGTEDPYVNQTNRALAEEFLESTLDFPAEHFDGVLLWDILQFLEPALLAAVMRRLHQVLRPASFLFALFHAQERTGAVGVYSCRIGDHRTILMQPRGQRKPAQYFNNRDLENLFQEFASVKFFLTRDSLREVIVRR